MSTTKHTPGVWGVPDKREHIVTVINKEGFEITVAKCGESYVLSDDEMKANARLIASAPDLLLALKNTLGAYQDLRSAFLGTHRDSPSEIINEARAAIAQCEGEKV